MADEHNPKGWTFASFEVWVADSIHALEKATAIAMTASEKAIDKAEKSDDKRFSLLNEFRATTNDQQANFANKDQTEFRLKSIDTELTTLKLEMREARGKGQGVWLLALIIGQVLLILIGATAVLLRH